MDPRKVHARGDSEITASVCSGHFATNHSHVNYCVDLTELRTNQRIAERAAALLALPFHTMWVQTILCLEGTQMLGAFLARELAGARLFGINRDATIHVLSPELGSKGQMIFHNTTRDMVQDKKVVLFLDSISTGLTTHRALSGLGYYNASVVGLCAGFSALGAYQGIPIHALFTEKDFSGYVAYLTNQCQMCEAGVKIDAYLGNFGYSELETQ